ncbi:MAG: hypothetical protein ACLGI7_08970, partial [Gammaproteobacteria bacterium]
DAGRPIRGQLRSGLSLHQELGSAGQFRDYRILRGLERNADLTAVAVRVDCRDLGRRAGGTAAAARQDGRQSE